MSEQNMRRHLHLLANSRSGKGQGSALAEIAKTLCSEMGADLTVYDIQSPEHLTDHAKKAVSIAQNSPQHIVVAAGGDGTIRSVAAEVAGTQAKMAVVACGTFNFFARTHSIPENQTEALRLAIAGACKPIRLGEINGHIFLINASLGLYAKSIQAREQTTKKFGRKQLVVIFSTIRSLLQRHRLLHVRLKNDEFKSEIKTPMIFIGNNALQLRNLSLSVANGFKHDLLAVVMLKPVRGWEMLRVIFRGIFKTLENEERLDQFSTDNLVITTKRSPQMVALDGETFYINSPLTVKALPDALNLIVPKPVLKDNTL